MRYVPYIPGMRAAIVAALTLAALSSDASAAHIYTASGERHSGWIDGVADGKLHVAPAGTDDVSKTISVDMLDVVRVEFPPPDRRMVVDLGSGQAKRLRWAKIPLKAGRHPIRLEYLAERGKPGPIVRYKGPQFGERDPEPKRLSRLPPGVAPPLPVDIGETDHRLAEQLPASAINGLRARVYLPGGAAWKEVPDYNAIKPATTAEVDAFGTAVEPADPAAPAWGVVIDGYIEVPDDGFYTFYLTSSAGARLYVGTPEALPAKPAIVTSGGSDDTPTHHVLLAGGEALRGSVISWNDTGLTISPSFAREQRVHVDVANLRELWLTSDQSVEKAARESLVGGAAEDEDTALVRKDDKHVAVRGRALGIDGDSLRFEYAGEERKLKLDRVAGIVFATHGKADVAGDSTGGAFHQVLLFKSGDALAGRWTGVADGGRAIVFSLGEGSEVTLPTDVLRQIRFVNGRVLYLSDLDPASVEQTPFFDRVTPWRRDTTLDGGKIRIGGRAYERGVSMHARTVLQYDLAGAYETLRSVVGFEEPAGRLGRAIIRVSGDGKTLWESLDAKGAAPPVAVEVSVAGIKRLTLEVDFGAGQDVGDRVVFADAQLVRKAAK
ncbi:MAG: hypothetical protein GC159_15825 [Phycisphaera sp.]|nr:hypothetical protein [Phycisphaera sp.]